MSNDNRMAFLLLLNDLKNKKNSNNLNSSNMKNAYAENFKNIVKVNVRNANMNTVGRNYTNAVNLYNALTKKNKNAIASLYKMIYNDETEINM